MNKANDKVMVFPSEDADDDKVCRKSITQIVEELRSKGINAEVCKRGWK